MNDEDRTPDSGSRGPRKKKIGQPSPATPSRNVQPSTPRTQTPATPTGSERSRKRGRSDNESPTTTTVQDPSSIPASRTTPVTPRRAAPNSTSTTPNVTPSKEAGSASSQHKQKIRGVLAYQTDKDGERHYLLEWEPSWECRSISTFPKKVREDWKNRRYKSTLPKSEWPPFPEELKYDSDSDAEREEVNEVIHFDDELSWMHHFRSEIERKLEIFVFPRRNNRDFTDRLPIFPYRKTEYPTYGQQYTVRRTGLYTNKTEESRKSEKEFQLQVIQNRGSLILGALKIHGFNHLVAFIDAIDEDVSQSRSVEVGALAGDLYDHLYEATKERKGSKAGPGKKEKPPMEVDFRNGRFERMP